MKENILLVLGFYSGRTCVFGYFTQGLYTLLKAYMNSRVGLYGYDNPLPTDKLKIVL